MKKVRYGAVILTLSLIIFVFNGCAKKPVVSYRNIKGFSAEANLQLKDFFAKTHNYKGRKIATFDMDGTVIGQAPHYLADESLYAYALKHPDRKPGLIKEMQKQSNTSIPYVANRVHYFAGLTPEQLEKIGNETYEKSYKGKFYPEIKKLINELKNNGFEVWVVTASPEFIYQGFVSKALGIPKVRIVGIKSVDKDGKTSDEIMMPIAQHEGKANAIESIIKAAPLLACGNSIDDFEMIALSKGLKIIVNPNNTEKVEQLGNLTLKQYAQENHWVIVYSNDVSEKKNPQPASKKFNVRINATNKKQ